MDSTSARLVQGETFLEVFGDYHACLSKEQNFHATATAKHPASKTIPSEGKKGRGGKEGVKASKSKIRVKNKTKKK